MKSVIINLKCVKPTVNPLFCRALTEIFLASPILGVIGTLKGDSGICSSLNLIDTKYSPASKKQ